MDNWYQYTRDHINEMSLHPSKMRGLKGQHFLVRYSVIQKIIDAIPNKSRVLEIGGGLGILTSGLVENGFEVTVIENDIVLVDHLKEKFQDQITVIAADAMEQEFPNCDQLVANLPYSIGTELLVKAFHSNIPTITVMLQKEVVDRVVAKPGDKIFSRISAVSQLYGTPQKLFDVPPQAFFPKPKVDSSVMQVELTSHYTQDQMEMETLYRLLFNQRNRTIRRVLRGYLKRKTTNQIIENIPYNQLRVRDISTNIGNEILEYLKHNSLWPVTE